MVHGAHWVGERDTLRWCVGRTEGARAHKGRGAERRSEPVKVAD